MMSNPHEYREALWAVLHDGVAPSKPAETAAPAGSKRGTSRPRRGMTTRDKGALDAFVKQIAQVQALKKP